VLLNFSGRIVFIEIHQSVGFQQDTVIQSLHGSIGMVMSHQIADPVNNFPGPVQIAEKLIEKGFLPE